MTDYTKCPGGFCQLTEYVVGGIPAGITYGCLGAKEGKAGGTDAHFVRQWSAWVCSKSWKAYAEMKKPPTNEEMIEHTKKFRASLRPAWMHRHFEGAA